MSLHDTLTIAILPLDIKPADAKANLDAAEQAIASLEEAVDVVVLPELFSTSYISEKEEAAVLAEEKDGETMHRIKEMAKKHMMAISGSFLSCTGDNLYNRGFILEPNGDATYYDKRHLFCISDESKVCEAGDQLPPVVRFRGWNISIAICYDLRFPLWLRNYHNRYDVMLVPSNWPEKRAYGFEHLLEARAIENTCYMVGANRTGEDVFGVYTPTMSQIYDFMGMPIGQQKGSAIVATLNRPALRTYRDHFPTWKDADEFRLG